jgi:hypothetical protein
MRAPSLRRPDPAEPILGGLTGTPILLVALALLSAPALARSLEVVGNAGHLGEWELSATLTQTGPDKERFSGPFSMTHVGMCTQDGPERKSGEIRLERLESSSRLRATLLVDGVECTYAGTLSGSYSGLMNCPDRRPVPLIMWVK